MLGMTLIVNVFFRFIMYGLLYMLNFCHVLDKV